MVIHRNRITASEEVVEEQVTEQETEATEEVVVTEGAQDLLFEAEDVAELLAEVTGEPVEVTAEEDTVVFAVGEDEFTVQADGNEEVLESVRKPLRGKKTVSAATQRRAGRTVRKAFR